MNVDNTSEASKGISTSSTIDPNLRDFCTGHPPKQSFLAPGGRTPPRFRMLRRSTLADKPELDSLLKAVMVTYKGEEFLTLNVNTIHCISQYLNGSKPLAHFCLFKRLMIASEAKKVRADLFVSALEHIGVYCEHLAVIAPFHTTEFGNIFHHEVNNLESSSDWERILRCLDNLRTLSFEHQADEPTSLTRDTLYALSSALASTTTLQKIKNVHLNVPPRVIFDYHHDFHDRQRRNGSLSSNIISSPLTIVGSDVIYADGAEVFGQLDDDEIFGKVDGIDTVEG